MDDRSTRPDEPTTDFDRDVHCVLGLPFDAVTLDQAVQSVRDAAHAKRRCFITTPNLNYVIACRTDASLRMSVLRSDLSVPDGMPLVWAARLLGIPLTERVAGSSLVDALRRIRGTPLDLFLFGGAAGVAAAACRTLNETGGGLRCVGAHSPGFGAIAELSGPAVLAEIDGSGADFLMVALPARKGQMWILDNLSRIAPPVVANLGAVINFIAGTVTRAPPAWQRLGLEWLWRIRQEPQLWRRYLHDGSAFMGLVFTQVLPGAVARRAFHPSAAAIDAARVTVAVTDGGVRLSLSGAWTSRNLTALREAFRTAVEHRSDVALDCSAVTHVDSACIGLLMLLHGHQEKTGHRLTLLSPQASVRRQLRRSGALYLTN